MLLDKCAEIIVRMGRRWLLREIVSRFYGVIRNILLCGMENDVYFFFS